ncbi:MAG: energy-coupling factor transporter transmembrane protein EcfT [Actinobacteria bacterium]|nr:energy-coupling factor transporter transmembrane protein EcfT [Actinomycetota bacterium]
MAFQVPFGQYLPGTTFIHTCDARVKIGVVIAFTFALFASSGWWAMALLAAVMWLGYGFAHVPFKIAAKGLKPLSFILIFTVLANALTFSAGSSDGAIALFGNFGFKPEGFLTGLYYSLRICLLVLATSLVTFTTNAVALADALTSLMRPLRALHVPVDDIATMFSIALRFIPTTAEEAEKIVMAQTARGVKFNEGGLLKRARVWVPVLVPLFVGLFRRADELACAMEARCYTGIGRTRLHEPVMLMRDWVTLCLAVPLSVVIGVFL